MFKVLKVVNGIFKRNYLHKSPEFQEGFKTALRLLEIGLENSTQHNWYLRSKEMHEELSHVKKANRQLQYRLDEKVKALDEITLFNVKPASQFYNYLVDCGDVGTFEILCNLDKDTFNLCLSNFVVRYTFKKTDEAKSKLLSYINYRNNLGFYAFKNSKVLKEFLNGRS